MWVKWVNSGVSHYLQNVRSFGSIWAGKREFSLVANTLSWYYLHFPENGIDKNNDTYIHNISSKNLNLK